MGGGEELTRKIFRSILTVGVAVLACSLLLVMGCFYSFYEGMQEHQLGDELRIAAAAVETNGSTYLEKIKSDRFRVTWIASDGTVLYDTQADAAQMENHLEREEVREALETGTGSSSRYSATLLQKTVYSASRLTDGTVLRLSASRATMGALLLGAFQPILLVVIVLLVLSSLLASRLAKRIVEPLNALDLEHPLENDAYEELSPLLRRIDRQRRQIDAQLAELRQKTDEFTQITAGMNEGLVLLDEKGAVLNINPAAQTLFGVTGACVGQDFLTVDREHSMSLALRTAMTDGHSEVRAERGGREYQFDLSRIESDGKVVGAVLLAFDMTAQAFAERSRREFTANVSHELKTPLQGIIGSAELLENGMVKPEDMPRFVGHIRAEAQRLVTLIGDIIRLSELDEGGELPTETVDLLPLASMRSLTTSATTRSSTTWTAAAWMCASAPRATAPVSPCATRASASRRSIKAASSSASTAWTRATPRRAAARVWDCPSSSTPWRTTMARSRSKARSARARRSPSASRRKNNGSKMGKGRRSFPFLFLSSLSCGTKITA